MSRFLVKPSSATTIYSSQELLTRTVELKKLSLNKKNLNFFSENLSSSDTFFRWHLGFLLLFTWTFPAIFSIPLFVAYGKFLSFTYGKFWSLSHIFISSLKDFLIFGIQTSHKQIWLHKLFSFRDRCTQWQNLRLFLRSILQ